MTELLAESAHLGAAKALVMEYGAEVLLLVDAEGTEPARREALLRLLTSAYQWGLRDGVPRGARLAAREIAARVEGIA